MANYICAMATFCNNLYIVGEETNIQDLGRNLNLKGWLKSETKKT
jgi:hypothetical protein